MSFEPRDYLQHIVVEADYLLGGSANLTFAEFVADDTIRRVFVRSLEIIGEATKKVPEDTRLEFPAVEWKKMSGMRDRLIHDYGGVDYLIVWDVAIHKASELATKLRPIVAAAGKS